MFRRAWSLAVVLIVIYWAAARAQQHPVLDAIASKVIQKYQQSSCEQLWKQKTEPKTPQEQKAIAQLRYDPQIRTEFINKIYESPSRLGPPLAYMTISDVTLQRPDKLRVITKGDGPRSEFFYDGKTMTAFAPKENLVAVAPAPPTIDAVLEAAYEQAATYIPFADVIVADPYKGMVADGLDMPFM